MTDRANGNCKYYRDFVSMISLIASLITSEIVKYYARLKYPL